MSSVNKSYNEYDAHPLKLSEKKSSNGRETVGTQGSEDACSTIVDIILCSFSTMILDEPCYPV